MIINVQTQTQGGHVIVYIINSNGAKILSVRDNSQGSCQLAPGYTYRFEFHVWSSQEADYLIQASVTPPTNSFPDFNWQRHYGEPHQDMGGFYFSIPVNA